MSISSRGIVAAFLIITICHQTTAGSQPGICTQEPENAGTVPKHLNEMVEFLCPLGCSGNHIFEHYNQSSGQYDVIIQQRNHTASIPIRQYSDAGTYRCRCSIRGLCHLKVDVVPDTVKANFKLANLNEDYNASCSAKGNPPPTMHAEFGSDDCNYTTMVADNANNFTRHLIINIPIVTEHCRNINITCFASQVQTMIQLKVTTSEQTLVTPTTTTATPPMTPSPTTTGTPRGRGTSTTHGASSVMLVFAGMIVVNMWKVCM